MAYDRHDFKECTKCKHLQPVSFFYKEKRGKLKSWCKSCYKQYYNPLNKARAALKRLAAKDHSECQE